MTRKESLEALALLAQQRLAEAAALVAEGMQTKMYWQQVLAALREPIAPAPDAHPPAKPRTPTTPPAAPSQPVKEGELAQGLLDQVESGQVG